MLNPPQLTRNREVGTLISDKTSKISKYDKYDVGYDGTWWWYVATEAAERSSQSSTRKGLHTRNILIRASKNA